MQVVKLRFQSHGDDRGQLVAIEEGADIPFTVKRAYWIYETGTGMRRGFHAHRKLEQLLICVHGSCRVLLDDGRDKAEVVLDQPDEALYVSSGTWREMYDFSEDAVLLVLASELYDESDYIRDYGQFLDYVSEGGR